MTHKEQLAQRIILLQQDSESLGSGGVYWGTVYLIRALAVELAELVLKESQDKTDDEN